MSASVSYFFNYPSDLNQLATDINLWLGCQLSLYTDRPISQYFTRFLNMDLCLSESEYLGEGEAPLGTFKYNLYTRTGAGNGAARVTQIPAMLIIAQALYQRMRITGLLVFELEIALAHYEECTVPGYGPLLYDTLSAKPVAGFLDHLADVQHRVPRSRDDFHGDKIDMP